MSASVIGELKTTSPNFALHDLYTSARRQNETYQEYQERIQTSPLDYPTRYDIETDEQYSKRKDQAIKDLNFSIRFGTLQRIRN